MRKLLQQYVRQILVENDGYGGAGDIMAMAGPMGISFGGPNLYQTFIEPFVDVAKVSTGAVKGVASSTRLNLKVIANGIAKAVIPFIEVHYVDAFKEADKRAESIKNEYKPILDRIDAKLFGDDAQLLSFLMNPTQFLAIKALKGSPKVALEIFRTLSGGKSPVEIKNSSSTSRQPRQRNSNHGNTDIFNWYSGGKVSAATPTTSQESLTYNALLITENNEQLSQLLSNQKFEEIFLSNPKEIFSNKKMVKILSSLPAIQKMRDASTEAVTSGISGALKGLDQISTAKSMQELQQIISSAGKNFTADFSSISDQNERQKIEQQALIMAKIGAADVYAKQFISDANRFINVGISKSSDLVKKFYDGHKKANEVIQRLRSEASKYNSNNETQQQPEQKQSQPQNQQNNQSKNNAKTPSIPQRPAQRKPSA